jgi:hypothetical protein
LQADWGNAALGAHDLGRATLAYRRALRVDPGLDRAHRNLAWVRKRAPGWLPRPAAGGALGSLLYWHDRLPSAARQLGSAAAFALAVLLLVPWIPGRGRTLRRLSVLPAALWMALTASVMLERDASADAVVTVDGTVLRAADSAGAPAALAHPLPAGAEVTIVESRDSWTRVALADGMRAWLPRNSLERVLR